MNDASIVGGDQGIRLASEHEVQKTFGGALSAYVCASSGTERDSKFLAHFSACKLAGLAAGLYLHFRQTRRPEFQLQVFSDAATVLGYGPGDLWPVLSFEDDELTDGVLNEEIYNVGGKILADSLAASYGGCLLKFSKTVWQKMLEPAWVFRFPIWLETLGDESDVLLMCGRSLVIVSRPASSFFKWAVGDRPVIPPPREDLAVSGYEDLAAGLETIARGLRKLGKAGISGAGGEGAHGHGGHGHGHGH